MKYIVFEKDSYGVEWVVDITENYAEAKAKVKKMNDETTNYLQACIENNEKTGNYSYFRIEEVRSTEEEKLEERIRMLMCKYVCPDCHECKMVVNGRETHCPFHSFGDEHLCELSGYKGV